MQVITARRIYTCSIHGVKRCVYHNLPVPNDCTEIPVDAADYIVYTVRSCAVSGNGYGVAGLQEVQESRDRLRRFSLIRLECSQIVGPVLEKTCACTTTLKKRQHSLKL